MVVVCCGSDGSILVIVYSDAFCCKEWYRTIYFIMVFLHVQPQSDINNVCTILHGVFEVDQQTSGIGCTMDYMAKMFYTVLTKNI